LCSCSKTEKKVTEKAVTEEAVTEELVTKKPAYFTDLIEFKGKLYEKDSDEPYTGDVTDSTGGIYFGEGYVHLGYRTGKWLIKKRIKAAPIFREMFYKDGKKVYDKQFFDNGEVEFHTTYWENGESKKFQKFNEKGEKNMESNYDENGETHGFFMTLISPGDTLTGFYEHGEVTNSGINQKPLNQQKK
jgi:antitoxin component YwqK of YwqJK toxin-antitoxin module